MGLVNDCRRGVPKSKQKRRSVPANIMKDLTYQFIRLNHINLNVALAGPKEGDPVILLHGFPDASFGWDKQINALAEAGFYVIAPDQRGYNLSDKPKGIENYRVELLVADIPMGIARYI